MNNAGGRVKAPSTIILIWHEQNPKNWRPRSAKISADAKRRTARPNRLSVPMRKATSLSIRMRSPPLMRDKPDTERVTFACVYWPELWKGNTMFGMIAAVLVVLWLLGFLAFHVAGGLIHI